MAVRDPQIWDEDELGPMPTTCSDCLVGEHPHPNEFFYRVHDNILYGPFSCDCPCDKVAFQLAFEGDE